MLHRSSPGSRPLLLLILGLIAFLPCKARAVNMFSIETLRCENRTNPLGIDQPHPRLSWQMNSSRRGQMQSAYRILVARSRDTLQDNRGDLWDSGKVAGDRSVGIEYSGSPLESRLRCYWKVIVWNADGDESTKSSPPALPQHRPSGKRGDINTAHRALARFERPRSIVHSL